MNILMLKGHKKLYIRLAKTGSTSLSAAFGKDVVEVTPSIKYEKIYRKHKYDFRFTFVRNPYDRMVSAYLMTTRSNLAEEHYLAMNKEDILNISFNEFIRKVIRLRNMHQELGIEKKNNIHLRPWKNKRDISKNKSGYDAYWLLAHTEAMVDSIEYFTSLESIDFIGKYETLSEDYARLGRHIQLSRNLEHLNASSSRKKYAEYYDNESIELVTQMYKRDLEAFEYQFDA